MSSIRLWHSYIGILIAPSVIFFALTGALQIFSLHESHGSYTPPVLIVVPSPAHTKKPLTRLRPITSGTGDPLSVRIVGE